jgi:hypothetical protein
MPDRAQRVAPRESGDPASSRLNEAVSVEDAIARYAGEWVLMAVTRYDSEHNATAGRILAHGSNRAMCRALTRLVGNFGQAARPLYLFSATPRVQSGHGLRAALDGAADAGAIGAWREW